MTKIDGPRLAPKSGKADALVVFLHGYGADGRDLTIAVAGCVAQAEGEEIMKRQPAVDIVVGPQAYHRLPELLAEAERKAAIRRAGLVRFCAAP